MDLAPSVALRPGRRLACVGEARPLVCCNEVGGCDWVLPPPPTLNSKCTRGLNVMSLLSLLLRLNTERHA